MPINVQHGIDPRLLARLAIAIGRGQGRQDVALLEDQERERKFRRTMALLDSQRQERESRSAIGARTNQAELARTAQEMDFALANARLEQRTPDMPAAKSDPRDLQEHTYSAEQERERAKLQRARQQVESSPIYTAAEKDELLRQIDAKYLGITGVPKEAPAISTEIGERVQYDMGKGIATILQPDGKITIAKLQSDSGQLSQGDFLKLWTTTTQSLTREGPTGNLIMPKPDVVSKHIKAARDAYAEYVGEAKNNAPATGRPVPSAVAADAGYEFDLPVDRDDGGNDVRTPAVTSESLSKLSDADAKAEIQAFLKTSPDDQVDRAGWVATVGGQTDVAGKIYDAVVTHGKSLNDVPSLWNRLPREQQVAVARLLQQLGRLQ